MNKFELLKRIKKIIIDYDVPITKISHIDVSDQLQSTYREYSRKTKSSFRKSVFDVIQKLCADIIPNLIISPDEDRTSLSTDSNINGSLNQLLLKRYKKDDSIPSDVLRNDDFFIDTTGVQIPVEKRKMTQENDKLKKEPSKKLKLEDDSLILKLQSKLYRVIPPSNISFSDLEGIEETIKDLEENFLYWIRMNSDILSPCGLILHGPSGCGKLTFAKALASSLNMNLISIGADELLPNLSSEMEQKLKNLLDQAISEQPCLISVNRIEQIATSREDNFNNVNNSKILTQFLQFIETISSRSLKVWIIGITSKIELIDPMLLMPGRLDEQIVIKMPDQFVRMRILKKFCSIYENLINNKMNISEYPEIEQSFMDVPVESISIDKNVDFEELSQCTPAYSGADLKKLVVKAFRHAILRQHSNPTKEICLIDFMEALKKMQPTSKKEDYVTIPNVTWKDVGALGVIRDELKISILIPVKQPDLMKSLGLNHPTGVLLFGPPGCGKTMIAKAVANEASINFISVKGPELLNMYVGESERNIRTLFRRAQDCSPCIIFFDEIDSICEKRSTTSDKGSNVKVVQQLLAELDGLQERRDLYIMGATNRLDRVDPAFLRENRFNKILYVGLPSSHERLEILQAITKNCTSPLINADVNLQSIANDERCSKFTGADLTSLVRTAARFLLKDLLNANNLNENPNLNQNMDNKNASINDSKFCDDVQILNSSIPVTKSHNCIPSITMQHFELAMKKVKPSIRQKDLEYYEKIAREYDLEHEGHSN